MSKNIRTKTMQCAFECMINENILKLSKKGTKELEKCWEGSSKYNWHIHAISVLDTLEICSDGQMIHRSAPLEWFIWDSK